MSKRAPRPERRRPGRPTVGDWKACSSCQSGMMLFTEQFCARTLKVASPVTMPAWVCDHCSSVGFVRAEHQPAALRNNAKKTRATASRTLMRARFVRSRAHRALQKSLARKKQRD